MRACWIWALTWLPLSLGVNIPTTQFNALTSLFGSLQIPSGTQDCASWPEVTCSVTGDVETLIINAVSVPGTLSPVLGQLPNLQRLELSQLAMSGTIPSEISNLQGLVELNLAYNSLTGTLPDLVNFTSLNTIYLLQNSLSGSIPASWANLTQLSTMKLSSQSGVGFTGSLTPVAVLRPLSLTDCYLDGWGWDCPLPTEVLTCSIPSSLGCAAPFDFQELATIRAVFNESGLPYGPDTVCSLGTWKDIHCNPSGHVTELLIQGASGPGFPNNLTLLKSLEVIDMTGSSSFSLSGTLPPAIGYLKNLTILQLCCHDLTGDLPAEWGQLSSLKYLNVYANSLSGSLPSEWGNMTNIRELHLCCQALSGTLPPSWGALSNLRVLYLYANQLAGPVPLTWTGMTSLNSVLQLQDNTELNGSIVHLAPLLAAAPGLECSFRHTNIDCLPLNLSGSCDKICVPLQPSQLVALRAVRSAFNLVTPPGDTSCGAGVWSDIICDLTGMVLEFLPLDGPGYFPTEIGYLSSLQTFNWAYRGISGTLPTELGRLTQLSIFSVYNNGLSGTIPTELALLSAADTLYLCCQSLKFSGTLPTEFGQMPNLRNLHFQENNLTGPIPSCWRNLTLNTLLAANNALTGDLTPLFPMLEPIDGCDMSYNQFTCVAAPNTALAHCGITTCVANGTGVTPCVVTIPTSQPASSGVPGPPVSSSDTTNSNNNPSSALSNSNPASSANSNSNSNSNSNLNTGSSAAGPPYTGETPLTCCEVLQVTSVLFTDSTNWAVFVDTNGQSGMIVSSGAVTLAGTLTVHLASLPADGSSVGFLQAGMIDGSFEEVLVIVESLSGCDQTTASVVASPSGGSTLLTLLFAVETSTCQAMPLSASLFF